MNNEKEYPVYSAEDIEKQKALDVKEKANNWQRLEEKLTSDVGEGVSNWAMDVNGAITVIAAGESFTVNGNAKIEPSDYFETFEDGTLPDTIQSVSTHPTIPSLGNSYTVNAPTIGIVDNNSTNALLLKGSYQSTKTFAKVSETTVAESGANKVVFETDIAFDWSTSGSDKEFFNIVLTDASGNIAFNLVGRNYQTGTNIQAVLRDSTGTSKSTFTLISGANGYSWHKLRIEYSYDETNGLAISIYVDNTLKTTWTTAYTSGTYIDDTDIANVYLLLNARTDSSHVINSTVALDNLKFEHVVAD